MWRPSQGGKQLLLGHEPLPTIKVRVPSFAATSRRYELNSNKIDVTTVKLSYAIG